MGKVFLIGCEAEYLRNVVGGGDAEEGFCSRGGAGGDEGGGRLKMDPSAPNLALDRFDGDGVVGGANSIDYNGETRAGSLVVHIRSGDIFRPEREDWHGMIWYGQVRAFLPWPESAKHHRCL